MNELGNPSETVRTSLEDNGTLHFQPNQGLVGLVDHEYDQPWQQL